jgi:hypothetical protein
MCFPRAPLTIRKSRMRLASHYVATHRRSHGSHRTGFELLTLRIRRILRGLKVQSYTSIPSIRLTVTVRGMCLFRCCICLVSWHRKKIFHLPLKFKLCAAFFWGACGSAVGWGTTLQAGRSRVPFPIRSLDFFFFFNLPNPSSHTLALGSAQSLTEMSTKNHPGGKG